MDKNTLDMFNEKLNEIKVAVDHCIEYLDNPEFIESPSTGKLIVVDFDDAALTDLVNDVEAIAQKCQELSNEVSSLL